MKGKGKGKAMQDPTDCCPLRFPDLTPIEHTATCPRYTATLARTEGETIIEDELALLQVELETLLVSVTRRSQLLNAESQALADWLESRGGKAGEARVLANKQSKGKVIPPASTPKRGRPQQDASKSASKKQKTQVPPATTTAAAAKASVSQSPAPVKKTAVTVAKSTPVVPSEYDFADSPMLDRSAVIVPKNDMPNRFWASTEPYCGDITQEDLKFLEELIRTHEDDAEYYKVPALGKHYSTKWAQEDLIDEQKESAKLNDKKELTNGTSATNAPEVNGMLKRAASLDSDEEESLFGPLTQRLVSALIEENIMAPLEDTALAELAASGKEPEMNGCVTRSGLVRSFAISNSASLERRIKRELEEHGLFNSDDEKSSENPDDEILQELRKRQSELKALTAHNLTQKKRLYKLAKDEMGKQEMRKKMQIADMEVMEAYRRISVTRQKKKVPTKKERDLVWKALKDRESMLRMLGSAS